MVGPKKVNKPCEDCGVMMENVSPIRKYCYACARVRRNECEAKLREKRRVERTGSLQPKAISNPYAKYCKGCMYWGGESCTCCNYIFYEGHSRGCPPGKDCTKRKTGKKPRHFEI